MGSKIPTTDSTDSPKLVEILGLIVGNLKNLVCFRMECPIREKQVTRSAADQSLWPVSGKKSVEKPNF
jgi:hypothetical protein